jgi:hypothetical protein
VRGYAGKERCLPCHPERSEGSPVVTSVRDGGMRSPIVPRPFLLIGFPSWRLPPPSCGLPNRAAPASGKCAPGQTKLAQASGKFAPASDKLARASGKLAPVSGEEDQAADGVARTSGALNPTRGGIAHAPRWLDPTIIKLHRVRVKLTVFRTESIVSRTESTAFRTESPMSLSGLHQDRPDRIGLVLNSR